jgi:hypothetical protein
MANSFVVVVLRQDPRLQVLVLDDQVVGVHALVVEAIDALTQLVELAAQALLGLLAGFVLRDKVKEGVLHRGAHP